MLFIYIDSQDPMSYVAIHLINDDNIQTDNQWSDVLTSTLQAT